MNKYNTLFGQLLSQVKRPDFDKLCKAMNSDKFRKGFSTWEQFGVMSFADYNDESRRQFIFDEAVSCWQQLSRYAADLGFESLMFEPMSVPREMGTTIAECREIMDRVNSDSAIPLKLCLDIGHAPHPDERDPYPWIEALGGLSPMVHLQQTVINKSNHSPFTKECNKAGIIDPAKVMAALERSGAKDALLAF